MEIATSLAALAMTDIYFSIFDIVYRKMSIFVVHIRLIAIELRHLIHWAWFINCLIGQGITMRVPALRRQWDVVVLDSV